MVARGKNNSNNNKTYIELRNYALLNINFVFSLTPNQQTCI